MTLFTLKNFGKFISGMIGPIKNVKKPEICQQLSLGFSYLSDFLNKKAKLVHQSKDLVDKIVVVLLTCYHIVVIASVGVIKNSECLISLQQ